MGVTPVRALNSIKRGGIRGVANNPVEFWILRKDRADSILGKRLTFLAEDFLIKKVHYKGLHIIVSYRIIVCNPEYTGDD